MPHRLPAVAPRFDLLPRHQFALLASITMRAIVIESAIAALTRGLLFCNSRDSTRASFTAAMRPATIATTPADLSAACLPSAPPLQDPHHFPGRLTQEHFRRDDVGASIQTNGTDHCDGADRFIRDRDAPFAPFATDNLDMVPLGSWHISAKPDPSKPAAASQ